MSLGPIMLDVIGAELTADDIRRLQHPLVGGVILWQRYGDTKKDTDAKGDKDSTKKDTDVKEGVSDIKEDKHNIGNIAISDIEEDKHNIGNIAISDIEEIGDNDKPNIGNIAVGNIAVSDIKEAAGDIKQGNPVEDKFDIRQGISNLEGKLDINLAKRIKEAIVDIEKGIGDIWKNKKPLSG